MRTFLNWVFFTASFVASCFADIRTFTDDQGRSIEATLVGVRGENVVLSRNGSAAQWPIKRLSAKDQIFVKAWQKDPPSTPKLTLTLWEREGVGPVGKYEQGKGLELPKNIPGLIETKETSKYKHYEIEMVNRNQVDANQLTVAYVMYVMPGQGGMVQELPASTTLETIEARKNFTAATLGATYVRTKTNLTTFSLNRGNLSTGNNRDVSKERFGGIWVRVYAQDGSIVGEAQDLHPEIKNLKPTWNGPKEDEHIPVMTVFEELEKLLEKLPKPPGVPNFPALPDSPKKPSLPKNPKLPALPF